MLHHIYISFADNTCVCARSRQSHILFVLLFAWHVMSKSDVTEPPPPPLSALDCSFWHYFTRLPVCPQVKLETGKKCKRGAPCHIISAQCMGLLACTAVIIVEKNNSSTESPSRQEGIRKYWMNIVANRVAHSFSMKHLQQAIGLSFVSYI